MIRWAKKVPMEKIARLYSLDAEGIGDEALLEDVAVSLYARCAAIVSVTTGFEKKTLPCPVCGASLPLEDGFFRCGCGFATSWERFRASYKGKQLYGANAMPAFITYMRALPAARSYGRKMEAVDALLHAFHVLHSGRLNYENYDPEDENNALGRPAAANLIEGSLGEVIRFLDALADSPEKGRWREIIRRANGGGILPNHENSENHEI